MKAKSKSERVCGSSKRACSLAHHLLREGTTYQDLGAAYFDERDREAVARRAVKRLERLGYKLSVEPAA